MGLWIAIIATAVATAAVLARAVRRGRAADGGSADVALYRDQLAEVDRDLVRGTLTPDEAGRIRAEVSRRLLAADRAAQGAAGTSRGPLAPVLVIAALLAAGAVWTYQRLGVPDYPDLPRGDRLAALDRARHDRPGQDEAETRFGTPWTPPEAIDPAYLDLVQKLRAAVQERPGDPQGLKLLVDNEANLGNFAAAWRAQKQLIDTMNGADTAGDQFRLAELMIEAAGGFVSPEAETALVRCLQLDPAHKAARYYAGLLYAQNGRFDQTMRFWPALLKDSAPDDPWVAPIRAQIEAVAALAGGARYVLPPERGPSAADVAAAGEMSAEDRQAMIRGMVDQLSDRLAAEGGPAGDWARLITSLGVLGETERARAIWTEAQEVFRDDAPGLATVRAAAEQAGVAG